MREDQQPKSIKKTIVLLVLFALPIVAYLFFSSGVHSFAKLPVLTENIPELTNFESIDNRPMRLQDSITVVTFLGTNPSSRLGNISNLNEMVFRKFSKFEDFQFVSIAANEGAGDIEKIQYQLEEYVSLEDWDFALGSPEDIQTFFDSFQSNLKLNPDLSSDFAFIIDKDRNLRGRDDDPDDVVVYGFDTSTPASLNNRMVDDIRVILAEYRFALKKNRDQRINAKPEEE